MSAKDSEVLNWLAGRTSFKEDRAALTRAAAIVQALELGTHVVVPKAEFQQALEAIKVPKMSPLKQDLFKAGTHAVIRAFNRVIENSNPTFTEDRGERVGDA